MLRVDRSGNGEAVFVLSGRIRTEDIAHLETLLRSERKACRLILDLKDVTLVNEEAVGFLSRCETDGVTLMNCPVFIRVWIARLGKE